jgi:hypothetical protein
MFMGLMKYLVLSGLLYGTNRSHCTKWQKNYDHEEGIGGGQENGVR